MANGTVQKPISSDFPGRLNQAEQQLRAEREKLLAELAIDSGSPDELADGWQDRDSASEDEIRELEFGHRGALRLRILRIEQAMERIRLGEYGRCGKCGRAIESTRLAEQPEVSFCLSCQELSERESSESTT